MRDDADYVAVVSSPARNVGVAIGPGQQEDSTPGGEWLPAMPNRTLRIVGEAVERLREAVDGPMASQYEAAVTAMIATKGHVVVSGMGKSGLVGRKIAATLSSTGTPAIFLHPADASHGDLGVVTASDLVLVLSWSGETTELVDLVSYCAKCSVPMIAVTSRPDSALARLATVALIVPDVEEACPNGLAPTSSTTVQMVLGDALAVTMLERRSFTAKDFHRFHPKGRLGTRLLSVADLMSTGDAVPIVGCTATMGDAVIEMTQKRFGATAIVDAEGALVGAFTDGDLRRSLSVAALASPVGDLVTHAPLTVDPSFPAAEALALMNEHQISQLFICSSAKLAGIIHLHDLLRAGVVLDR